MTDDDKKVFAASMAEMFVCYSRTVTQEELRAWFNQLKSYPIQAVQRAFVIITRTEDYPTISKVCRVLDGEAESAANEQWHSVLNAIRSNGANYTVVFDDARTMQAINSIGGWQSLCMISESQADFKRKEFITAYVDAVHRPQPLEQIKALRGRCHDDGLVQFFGEQHQCELIYQQQKLLLSSTGKVSALLNEYIEQAK